jgi:hypothetical protein
MIPLSTTSIMKIDTVSEAKARRSVVAGGIPDRSSGTTVKA